MRDTILIRSKMTAPDMSKRWMVSSTSFPPLKPQRRQSMECCETSSSCSYYDSPPKSPKRTTSNLDDTLLLSMLSIASFDEHIMMNINTGFVVEPPQWNHMYSFIGIEIEFPVLE